MKRAAALLFLALASAGAQAGCAREFNVGMPEPSVGAYIEKGEWRGLLPEMLDELARRSGCSFKLLPLPRARMVLQFDQGELDVLTSVTQTPERDSKGRYMPYAFGALTIIVTRSDVHTVDDLRRRPELKLGTVRGLRLGRLQGAVDSLPTNQVEYSANFSNLIAKLTAGRLQAAVLPSVVEAKMRLDGQLPVNSARLELPGITPEVVGLYLSHRVTEADFELLQRHLDAMRREGWIRARYVHYVGETETKRLFRNDSTR
ncbi:MAG: ABC transporter substrate-binding protein [Rubrivivax sp.]|nr:MAG: ABC transporter substrate-binding protein [Rubrivivax sp.]